MGWEDHLTTTSRLAIPWLGGRKLYRTGRSYQIKGRMPRQHGWYLFDLIGRRAYLIQPAEVDWEYGDGLVKVSGYLLGDRMVSDDSRAEMTYDKVQGLTNQLHLVEPGLPRFSRGEAIRDPEGRLIYMQQVFDRGPEDAVRDAFIARAENLDGIPGVTPPLVTVFNFASELRRLTEERRAEFEARRQRERDLQEALSSRSTGAGRRVLARHDFEAAAASALAEGGAELLDIEDTRRPEEAIVRFRTADRAWECVVERQTLGIIDAGICLTDSMTGEAGDTYFTLESLPGVIRWVISTGGLHVYRHVEGSRW